jgi:hypothetical protein
MDPYAMQTPFLMSKLGRAETAGVQWAQLENPYFINLQL